MSLIKITFIYIIFLIIGCGDKYTIPTNPNDNIVIETNHETDLDFLNSMILLNNLLISNPLDLGIQTWENNRLTELEIQNYSEISIIPSSIYTLEKLTKLILNNNSIIHIPSNICLLEIEFSNPNQFSISNNFLCPNDVPYCIENYIESDNQSCDWDINDILIIQEIINLNGLNISPNEFGSMQIWDWGRLTSLIISGNDGYGYIHTLPENIYNLDKLEYIDLNNHLLNNLPESFGYLDNLIYLNLNSNRILYLPESFSELSLLSELNLFDNRLSFLPISFQNLQSCINLDLSYNLFENFPEEIIGLQSLEELDLSINYIQQFPENIFNLENLVWLDLHYNEIQNLSNSIYQLNNLNYLDIGYNSLENLTIDLEQLSNLNTLYLDNNNLNFVTGTICNSNIDYLNPYNFIINNNNLCIESVPDCIADTQILGTQNCFELISKDLINH